MIVSIRYAAGIVVSLGGGHRLGNEGGRGDGDSSTRPDIGEQSLSLPRNDERMTGGRSKFQTSFGSKGCTARRSGSVCGSGFGVGTE